MKKLKISSSIFKRKTSYRILNPLFWGEIKPFDNFPIAFTNRFDEVIDRDQDHWFERQAIGGLAYIFPNNSKIILNVRRNWSKENGKLHNVDRLEVITEIRF